MKIVLYLKTFSSRAGKAIPVHVDTSDTVASVREKINAALREKKLEEAHAGGFHIISDGKQWEDDKTLAYYNRSGELPLHVLLSPLTPTTPAKQSTSLFSSVSLSGWFKFSCFRNPFASKPIEYWRNKFESSINHRPSDVREALKNTVDDWFQFIAARELLYEYSGKDYTQMTKPSDFSGGDSWDRLYAKRWGTHHGKAVSQTLDKYANSGLARSANQTVHDLISTLKTNLGKQELNVDGDLSRILTVIKEKTGVCLDNVQEASASQTPRTK